jgi:signal peptidase I
MDIHNTIVWMNPENTPKKENFFKEIVKFTLIALAIVIPIRTYIAQPFVVKGDSMDPTFSTGQYLIVDQLSYKIEDPKRGEVIILRYPVNPSVYFIKRIVGLPGETLAMNSGKLTIVNTANPDGFVLDEPYITEAHKTSESFQITLGETEYFVMGDNRPASSDSRNWGPLDSEYVTGRPLFRLFPLTKISVFPGR